MFISCNNQDISEEDHKEAFKHWNDNHHKYFKYI